MKRLIVISIGLCLLALTPAESTLIQVSGPVSGAWTADTVKVMSEIWVPTNLTLTISPGVKVFFASTCKFRVDTNATLIAAGITGDSILFDVFPGTPDWRGLRLLGASSTSRLAYCHITAGEAVGTNDDSHGGAILCRNSSPTITHCLINNCSSEYSGGGICCYINAHPKISYNTIIYNHANGSGGGISVRNNSHPEIAYNSISENSAAGQGGGIFCYYSGLSTTINNNWIYWNLANNDHGGGIACLHSSPTISYNKINWNEAAYGGGINCDSLSSPIIDHDTLSWNSAIDNGGGLWCGNFSNPVIVSNTVNRNIAGWAGGGMRLVGFNGSITNTVFAYNGAHLILVEPSQ